MGALPEALEIIFEMQRKGSNEKITKEINFPIYKTCFLPFIFFFRLLLSNFITLLIISYSFK
jgi:hypothetical protein